MANRLVQLADLSARIRAFIASGRDDSAAFDELALDLFAFQFEHNPPYRRYCLNIEATPERIHAWTDLPAIVTSAFKTGEWTVLTNEERSRVFCSSGTTARDRSRHFHSSETLRLYEASLLAWFKPHLLPDRSNIRFVFLSPIPSEAPHSSLVHMFQTVSAFGSATWHASVQADGAWALDAESVLRALEASGEPAAICGAAFSFVHLHDFLAAKGAKLRLPPGSRAFETGGYKGRSRAVPKEELHAMIAESLGLSGSAIISEYGMSELSSQAYDRTFGRNDLRLFRFPPWARAVVISPETGRAAAEGEAGLLRVCDLANVGSVTMVQTEDLAVRRGQGFELLGRAALAEPRGCSLMPSA